MKALIALLVLVAVNASAGVSLADKRILMEVANEPRYSLTVEETKLLIAIRIFENGGPGIELGVGSDFPNHRARRYAGNHARSLRLQAQWAAGTIKRRYRGNSIEKFARIYCPPNHRVWSREVRKIMRTIDL